MTGTVSAAEIAGRLGLKRHPRSWRGSCPACDYPRAFSIRDGRDHRPLLFCSNGCNHDALDDAMQRVAGGTWKPPERPDPNDETATRERKQRRALALWNGSEPAPGTLADRYLTTRGLPGLAASPALRFRGDCPHPEGGRLPAMVAAVTNTAGEVVAVHRTYLRRDGSGKADVEPAKASLGPVWAGAIRLDLVAAEIVIGEGIETSAGAGRLMALPAWAALSAGNLRKGLVLPPQVRSVVIAADPDKSGRDAARDAWFRWRAEGRTVRIATPDREGCDFNDLLMQRAREATDA